MPVEVLKFVVGYVVEEAIFQCLNGLIAFFLTEKRVY